MPKSSLKAVFVIALAGCLLVSGCARAPKRVSTSSMMAPQTIPSPASTSAGFYHMVERGQTVYRIAKNYSMDWHELMRVNRISNPSSLEVGQQLFIPRSAPVSYAPVAGGPLDHDAIRRLVGAPHSRSVWRTITVHHSGTHKGSAKQFHRDHTRRHMGGLFYHFVIGNRTNSSDGGLEVGFRWQRQVKANRPNDIQICLVGDFNDQFVSEAQFSTLLQLIQILNEDYRIGTENIRKHEDIKGKHTACPGRHFPFQRLISELSRR